MEKNNRFLLVVAFVILIIIVVFTLNNISGKVTHNAQFSTELNPSTLTFSRQDASHIVNIIVATGPTGVDRDYFLREYPSGDREKQENLCTKSTCEGVISDNVLISADIPSGEYYFEFTKDCTNNLVNSFPELCKDPTEKITFQSPILTIEHE